MRYRELVEADVPVSEELMQVFHNMKAECRPFLKEIDNRPARWIMYRGMNDQRIIGKGLEDDYGIKTVRLTDRRPKDTPEEGHASLNEYFNKHYGHPYRNGLFVTGNEMAAESYGMPYAVLPIGKFDYIWNRDIDDMTTEIYDYIEGTQDGIENGLIHEHYAWRQFYYKTTKGRKWVPPGLPGVPASAPVTLEQMTEFMKGKTDVDLIELVLSEYSPYISKNLRSAISHGPEIMIWCQEYYYMDPVYLDKFQKFLSK